MSWDWLLEPVQTNFESVVYFVLLGSLVVQLLTLYVLGYLTYRLLAKEGVGRHRKFGGFAARLRRANKPPEEPGLRA